ncbi:uncharacterized protein Nmag_0664 [Natrialba magadii ATCC 43099]|uniref:Uncharacterized protein n=1 Tax=Natrialba magadii (strain ATCC 43099 / DSM 3394 / CCM 3739 / CIP 104546 / IAM 13178 / JCM 8861 / NBRC 102185 / NCIMB 2190 / MS3) TaxID=547559 RepID=D3SZB5_NATMM|nr:hypothetical protein [Natrialba magadii]ADD04249.1 uncharacterized protein Nmag_0664 [Natrialba magadii ATCC 43099]ELY26652.1 hypothetical protein C500_15865 [Natrialba magadii ATCC 43099]
MRREFQFVAAGTAVALVGFLPELYLFVRSARAFLLALGLVIASYGLFELVRHYAKFDLA